MIQVNRQSLIEALTRCSKVVASKSPSQILQHARLELSSGRLCYRATNLTTAVSGSIEAVGEPVAFCVSPLELAGVLKALNGEIAKLDPSEGALKVSATGKRSFKVRTLPADDFPNTADTSGETVPVPARALFDILRSCKFACGGENELREPMKCIHVSADGTLLSGIALDGHKAAIYDVIWKQPDHILDFLLPVSAAQIVLDSADPDQDLTVRADARSVQFQWGTEQFQTRIPGGEFPPARSIIDSQEFAASVELNSSQMSEIIKATLRVSSARDLVLSFEPGRLLIESHGEGYGVDEIEISCPEPMRVACNGQFILDAVASCGEKFTLSYHERMLKLDSEEFTGVIMPIVMQSVEERMKI